MAAAKTADAPALEQVVKPKVTRTHTGRAVVAQAWKPKTVK